MSDSTLTPDAPGGAPAAVPEGTAPEGSSEVAGGSAEVDLSNFIEKSRFDGLMGTYNREKDTWARERQQYEAELASLRNPTPNQEEAPVADNAALDEVRTQVSALTEMLMSERLENARLKAVEEYPEAKPFADMLIGQTPEQIRQAAANVAERAKMLIPQAPETPAAGGEQAQTPEAGAVTPPTAPPVAGGTVPVGEQPNAQTKVAEAVQSGSWTNLLSALAERATADSQLA